MKEQLHVGGPRDGERRDYPPELGRIVLPRPTRARYVYGGSMESTTPDESFQCDYYTRTRMVGPDGLDGPVFTFWRHESLTPDQGCALAWARMVGALS